jgi:hypothetical protein
MRSYYLFGNLASIPFFFFWGEIDTLWQKVFLASRFLGRMEHIGAVERKSGGAV